MITAAEQQVLQSLTQQVTALFGTQSAGTGRTVLQWVPLGTPVNASDLSDAVTPANPRGSLLASEQFSRMVDIVPAPQANFVPTSVSCDDVYGQVVELAQYNVGSSLVPNSRARPAKMSPEQSDMTGLAFSDEEEQFLSLLSGLDDAHFKSGVAPMALLDAVRTPAAGANALDLDSLAGALSSSSAVLPWDSPTARLFNKAQALYMQTSMVSQMPSGTPWHLSYPDPGNWCQPNAQCFTLLRTGSTPPVRGETAAYSSLPDLFRGGLWQAGRQSQATGAADLELSAELATVRIMRPWLSGSVFRAGGWNMGNAYPAGAISPGSLSDPKVSDALMPLIPLAMVVARRVQMTATWPQQDRNMIAAAVSGQTTVAWGPFRLGAGATTFDSGILQTQGLQIIGWLSQVLPFCPPQ